MSVWMSALGGLAGLAALIQIVWRIVSDRKAQVNQKGAAEAAKASLDSVQAEASLPHVVESLRLGNLSEAVAVQQQIINGLREHVAWQSQQLEQAVEREAQLAERLAARDAKIAELEERLTAAENLLDQARKIIDGLKTTVKNEHDTDHPEQRK